MANRKLKCRGRAVPREALLKKKIKSSFATRSAAANFVKVCTFTLQLMNKVLFSTVYDILASFSDLTNPPLQYSIYVVLRAPPRQLSLLVVVSLKLCVSFVPSHLIARILITLQCNFNRKCTHVTAYETDATKRLSLALRLRLA